MRKLSPILLALAFSTAFAADPAPWRPAPEMTGTFRSVAGDNRLIVAPDGHCEISDSSTGFHAVGSIRPEPDGESNRFLAELRENTAHGGADSPDTATILFAYAPADRAWQMLSMDVGNGDVFSLEEESSMTVDGGVERDDMWFFFRFVPDPASFDWSAAVDTVCRHFAGTWKNLGDDSGATMVLSPDGMGTIENPSMGSTGTCKWSVVRHDNGWRVVCEIMDRGTPSVEPIFAVLEADPRFSRLRLVNVTRYRGLAMADDNQESLSDPDPTYFDRIDDTPPAAPAPWRPAPEMTGTFRSVAGGNLLEISPDARIKLDFDSSDDAFVGTFLPDPSGVPNRYLATVNRTSASADESDEPEPGVLVLSFDSADAVWQLLGGGESPDEVQWIEDMPEYGTKRDGIVVHKKGWFETRFVSDRPLPADAPEATPEAARQRLVGVWENFAGEFGGVAVILAPNGYGIFGAAVMSMPCSWRIRKTDDGWLLACKIYEGSPFPGKSDIFYVLKADPRLQRLRLLAVDRSLEAATAAADALGSDAPATCLYRSCDTVPPELAERLAATISSLQANPANPNH